MFRGSVLLLALAMSSPALWSTFVTQTMGVYPGLLRFLIALPVAAVMLAIFRSMTARYEKAGRRARREAAIREIVESRKSELAD